MQKMSLLYIRVHLEVSTQGTAHFTSLMEHLIHIVCICILAILKIL